MPVQNSLRAELRVVVGPRKLQRSQRHGPLGSHAKDSPRSPGLSFRFSTSSILLIVAWNVDRRHGRRVQSHARSPSPISPLRGR
jgi:hypothetical protein